MPRAFCSNAGLPGSFTKALSYDEQIQFLIDKYNKMADVINNLKIDTDISDVVKYIPQTGFSELQKQQARNNIGAGTSNITSGDISTQIDNNSVKFSGAQNLTEDQKAQARNNIGCETGIGLIPTSITIPTNDTFIDSTKSSLKYYKIGNIIFMTGVIHTRMGASDDWKDTSITVPIPDNPCILYGYSTYKDLRYMINAQGLLRIYIKSNFSNEDFYISAMYTVNQ